MAVLVEAISVLVRVGAIHERYPGGWPAFANNVPNRTLCSDSQLARVGFMSPEDCKSFIGSLENFGILYLKDGQSQEIAVVDQMRGFAAPCDWADFGRIEMKPGQTVSAAQLKGTTNRQVFCPDGWKYEDSLSQQFGFVPTGQEGKSLKFIRRESSMDVYLNLLTGKEVYIGRADTNSR